MKLPTAAEIQRYLQSQNTTLYGRAFNVSDDPTEPALWLHNEIKNINQFLQEEKAK